MVHWWWWAYITVQVRPASGLTQVVRAHMLLLASCIIMQDTQAAAAAAECHEMHCCSNPPSPARFATDHGPHRMICRQDQETHRRISSRIGQPAFSARPMAAIRESAVSSMRCLSCAAMTASTVWRSADALQQAHGSRLEQATAVKQQSAAAGYVLEGHMEGLIHAL